MTTNDKYPRGKLCDSDEGQLIMVIGVHDKTVILEFGKDVSWLGLPKEHAIALGNALIEKANTI